MELHIQSAQTKTINQRVDSIDHNKTGLTSDQLATSPGGSHDPLGFNNSLEQFTELGENTTHKPNLV